MVHTLALSGICARRNGINVSLAVAFSEGEGLAYAVPASASERNRLCRKFLASIFRTEPKFAPELMKELDFNSRNDITMASDFDGTHRLAAIRQVRKMEAGSVYG